MSYDFGPVAYLLVIVGVLVVLFLRFARKAGGPSRTQRTLHAETLAGIEWAVRDGDTIAAIRLYREWMGCSAAEAKAAVEVIAKRMATPH